MFKRLNTGGARLSDQEIRNCTIRLLGNKFNDFIIELSQTDSFKSCIANVSDEKIFQKFDQELVLRFFAFKNWTNNFKHDLDNFMTDYMEGVTTGELAFDYTQEKQTFERTFLLLSRALGDQAFSSMNKKGNLVARFMAYHYEAFTVGIQTHLDNLEKKTDQELEALLKEIKGKQKFIEMTTGGGKNYLIQLLNRINFVKDGIAAKL